MLKIHELKTWPKYFHEVKSGVKKFEIRKFDRDFRVGDELILREFVPENYYEDQTEKEYFTGNICHRRIDYLLSDSKFGIQEGYVVLGISPV